MHPLVEEVKTDKTPEQVAAGLMRSSTGLVLLRSSGFDKAHARYSFVAANPFLTFRSLGSRCEIHGGALTRLQYGDPWHLLDSLMSRYELLEELDLPFPPGGCFGYWGYDLKNFVEPTLQRRAPNDLEIPDCHAGFYDSLIVFDHRLSKAWIVSTGLAADGSRNEGRAHLAALSLKRVLEDCVKADRAESRPRSTRGTAGVDLPAMVSSTLRREEFISRVQRAQEYIQAGDIYQVNLSHRLSVPLLGSGFELFERLAGISPAPFSAFLDCGEFQICSSSPELFMRMSGRHIQTRPIKGTRPRAADPDRDAQLSYELQTSSKEMAELVMITDLLRNDLGRVCEFGSIHVPELARLEKYPQVQHLVSTVEGRLRNEVTHFAAFAACFPGGSVTGAPKIRAMEIIDELEPVSRGPYTGALGYLGFNRESQLGIVIRTAIKKDGLAFFSTGAGIVADSDPAAEYEETLAKASGFLQVVGQKVQSGEIAPATISTHDGKLV